MDHPAILVVDDERNTRLGVSFTLQEEGKGKWTVDTAENGKKALEALREIDYDLLITDVRMPALDGIQLLEQMKKENISVTSFLLTGFAEFEYAQKGLHFGVIDYLLKPVEQEELLQAVYRGLDIAKRNRELEVNKFLVDSGMNEVASKSHNSNQNIDNVVHYISNNLNTPLAIKDVANHVHLNPSYLSVLFKEEIGVTFSDFVTKQRLKKAKELLIFTDTSLDEIAGQIGYQTCSYFIKIFKRFEGVTPKQYRTEFQRIGKLR
jgi:two-component system, response regulator YesN